MTISINSQRITANDSHSGPHMIPLKEVKWSGYSDRKVKILTKKVKKKKTGKLSYRSGTTPQ